MIDSSPSSAESSFRELDEVFLQTQTRIWLGEVLNTRLDEDLPISDLLQDGEILFEVSKVVWNLLLTKCKELRHLKHKYGLYGSKKSGGRYRPYSNVDSFLKLCKILGLSGIDLFSPSDVVEKRDVRKVCICIRALSKKARSKLLSVPDFDMVTYSITMPTDMVGVIRRSLESSQYTISSSSSYTSHKGSETKSKQKILYAPTNRDDDSSSEESDEAESRYMGENSFPSAGKFNYADGVNFHQENSPEAHSVSWKKSYSGKEERHSRRNGTAGNSNINFAIENDNSVVGDSSCTGVEENNYISDYLAFSDLMVHATNGDSPIILDGEKNMFDFFLNVDSHGCKSDKKSFLNGSQGIFSDDEDVEVSSTTSMSSVLGRLLNLEFDDQFDEDEPSSPNLYVSESKERVHCRDLNILSDRPTIDVFQTQSDTVLLDSQEDQFKMASSALLASSTKNFPPSQKKCELASKESPAGESHVITDDSLETLLRQDKGNKDVRTIILGSESDIVRKSVERNERSSEQLHNVNVKNSSNQGTPPVVSDGTSNHNPVVQENASETFSHNHSYLPAMGAQEDAHVSHGIQDNKSSSAENGSQEENISDRRIGKSTRMPHGKHGRRPLLKTVFKGTAIAGGLFLLLHISKIGRGNHAEETPRVSKQNRSKSSSTKLQTGSVGKGVYPAEKIKL